MFETGLRVAVNANAAIAGSADGLRIKAMLVAPSSWHRTQCLNMAERHARIHLGYDLWQAVDWTATTIDWITLLQFLMAVLPFVLMLFGF